MEELIKALEELFDRPDVELEGDSDGFRYFKSGKLVDHVESLCCEHLISGNGDCDWKNIEILRQNGYSVFAGEKDSFGWLTGCVRKKDSDKVLVYG